jgi:serine/threonine protein kinase/Tol biopolymer transport system component
MPLASGTKLGPYEILSPLGAGGMGEVYRARDSRLDRDVAIKVLPASLASDPNLRQRLEREAKSVSRLSHPHICTLYDIGQQAGTDFLVMELLDGETLEQRLLKGPLPPDQVLRYSAQIADALAKAHKLGIVHRDLKPGNIMLTKTGAKLMDFGLAKSSERAPLADALNEMTAEHSKLTVEGAIVGTFQYMAPEQLEGHDADDRTDIFALGEVIYEMATGKPTFSGKSRASLIASILTNDPPPMSQHQPMAPVALERVVKKCLAKDPDERWQNASDLASELKWIAEGGSQIVPAAALPASAKKDRLGWLVAAASLLLLLAGGALWWNSAHRTQPPMYFHAAVPFAASSVAISPNGKTVALTAYSAQLNDYALWTYEIGSQRTNLLDGTQGAAHPFWSPDDKYIGFFADGKLKKIGPSGGKAQIICVAPNGRGGTWNRDGVILFSPDALHGVTRVSAAGGAPVDITTIDLARHETSHRWPVFLPDGKHFLYLAANFAGNPEINAIAMGSLDSSEKRIITPANSNVAYVEPGYLVYLRDRTLVAQPFSAKTFAVTGEPRALSDDVLFYSQIYRAVFDASSDVLVTQTGKVASLSELSWFDRNGKAQGKLSTPAWYYNVRFSPDGRKVAVDQTDPEGKDTDIYVHDLQRGAVTRLTFNPALDQSAVWSPDGSKIIFSSNRRISFRMYIKNADGIGSEQEVSDQGTQLFNPWDWSHDGKYILFRKGSELGYLTLADGQAKMLTPPNFALRGAQFSPDGRWFAYASSEGGNMEVYVSTFPDANGKWQISTGGGQEPRWRRDGKELFYISSDGKMMSVPILGTTSFEAGTPVPLFTTHRRQPVSSQDVFCYDVTPDGQKFLIVTNADQGPASPLSITLNWTSEPEK